MPVFHRFDLAVQLRAGSDPADDERIAADALLAAACFISRYLADSMSLHSSCVFAGGTRQLMVGGIASWAVCHAAEQLCSQLLPLADPGIRAKFKIGDC